MEKKGVVYEEIERAQKVVFEKNVEKNRKAYMYQL